MNVRTRFAPSPTGVLHLGSVRTALFSWLYARHHGGQFILRIEDTDRLRSTSENVEAITDGMDWLGLDADEGPYFQTDRFERYRAVIARWLDEGVAYNCYCTREELEELRAEQMACGEKTRYDGRCRHRMSPREGVLPVVRFKNPSRGEVVVNDLVRGKVVFKNSELDDLIIARSDGSPTYNFTVVVDDDDMRITHVIRGDDHLNNTPRQMNLLAALNAKPPVYAHLPMILGPDGAKLSKRHGAVDIRDYRERGYLPEAVLNYLVRLGWSHGDREVFTAEEMIELFDVADVNQSASSFNPEKMLWVNQQHIMRAPVERIGAALVPYIEKAGFELSSGPAPAVIAEAYRERADTLETMVESARFCFVDFDAPDPKAAKKHLRPVVLEPMRTLRSALAELPSWTKRGISDAIDTVARQYEISLGKIGQPVRVAVTGGSVSPPIDITLWLAGRDRSLSRLDKGISFIVDRSQASEG